MATLKGVIDPPCSNPTECYQRCKNGAFPCRNPNPNQKVYTHNPCGPLSKNHALVIAAYQKGLTGIKIVKGLGKGAARTGWTLECDQVPKLHLGYEIKEAEARINKISI
jgi:hypothetical protein